MNAANTNQTLDATKALALRLRQPLHTERLLIAPIRGEFAERSFALYEDDALYAWIGLKRPQSIASLRADWQRLETPLSPDGAEAWLCWQLQCKATGQVIGMADANITIEGVATNLGYYIFVPHWRKGYALEACNRVIQHLINNGVHTIAATVTVGNTASKNLLCKLGFVYHQLLKDNDSLRGRPVDDWEFVYRHPSP